MILDNNHIIGKTPEPVSKTVTVSLSDVSRRFSGGRGLGQISFELVKGQCCAVIGANGSGKTTLLRCLSALEPPGFGNLQIGPVSWSHSTYDQSKLHKNLIGILGFVFQNPEPWPHLTVLGNLLLPLTRVGGLTREDAINRAKASLLRFGLDNRMDTMPHQLSGGLRQRVVMARVHVLQPEVLILDEPTSALDPVWSEWVSELINEYKSEGNTVIVVSHQMGFVRRVADRVIYLDEGLIKEEGKVSAVLDHPEDEHVRRFLLNV